MAIIRTSPILVQASLANGIQTKASISSWTLPLSSVALAIEDVSRDLHKLVLFTGAGSSDITGKNCSASAAYRAYDTYALVHGAGSAIVKQGGKNWYCITAD